MEKSTSLKMAHRLCLKFSTSHVYCRFLHSLSVPEYTYIRKLGGKVNSNSSVTMEQRMVQSMSFISPMTTLTNNNSYAELKMVSTSGKASLGEKSTSSESFSIRKAQTAQEGKANTLVVLFGFYRASENAIKRYCNVYHKYGFDVVYVKSVLKHFSWPKNSVVLADSLLTYLENQCADYDHFLVHAFSMGAYNFTVCMGTMYDKPDLYSKTQSKICGIVYDSLTIGSLENMSAGVATGVSKNVLVRKMIVGLANTYFYTTYKNTVMFYDHYVNLFKVKPFQVPTLMFFSRNDPMSDAEVIEAVIADWDRRFSFQLVAKGWDQSKHAAHLLTHGEEYLSTVDSFLRSIPALSTELKPVSQSKL